MPRFFIACSATCLAADEDLSQSVNRSLLALLNQTAPKICKHSPKGSRRNWTSFRTVQHSIIMPQSLVTSHASSEKLEEVLQRAASSGPVVQGDKGTLSCSSFQPARVIASRASLSFGLSLLESGMLHDGLK